MSGYKNLEQSSRHRMLASIRSWIFYTIFVIGTLATIIFGGLGVSQVRGEEKSQKHNHPPEDSKIHEQFYKGWWNKNANISCCSMEDCFPVTKDMLRHSEKGELQVQSKWTKAWINVPDSAIDYSAVPPDGRTHACVTKPANSGWGEVIPGDVLRCFTYGTGT